MLQKHQIPELTIKNHTHQLQAFKFTSILNILTLHFYIYFNLCLNHVFLFSLHFFYTYTLDNILD